MLGAGNSFVINGNWEPFPTGNPGQSPTLDCADSIGGINGDLWKLDGFLYNSCPLIRTPQPLSGSKIVSKLKNVLNVFKANP